MAESIVPSENVLRTGSTSSPQESLEKTHLLEINFRPMTSGRSTDSHDLRGTEDSTYQRTEGSEPSVISCVSMKSDHSMDFPLNFKNNVLNKKELSSALEPKLADTQEYSEVAVTSQSAYKSFLKRKLQNVHEGVGGQLGNACLFQEAYTELYIVEGDCKQVNMEHEIRQMELCTRKLQAAPEKAVKCEDMFKPLSGQERQTRVVFTKGLAGIGKTYSVQKLMLDWAEDKACSDIGFLLSLQFRELNRMRDEQLSLFDLLKHFHMTIEEGDLRNLEKYNVIIVFDGLDECRLPLDFQKNPPWTDMAKATSVDVLLTNLIKGDLLPSASVWITARPAAANKIPPGCVDVVTEIRGFLDPQKEEYFRGRYSDENLATRAISHVKSARSLYIMCHIPLFCWIMATVLEDMLDQNETREIPKTLTEMYIRFLEIQIRTTASKYGDADSSQVILTLGKVAFIQLEKGNLIFYEEDLVECGIDVNKASVYSGVFTQIFKEEHGLCSNKVFCFVHLSIQEFLAAVYKTELNRSPPGNRFLSLLRKNDFYQRSVDDALQTSDGHLDLYLRFLLGLSLETNWSSLQSLLEAGQAGIRSGNREKICKYIKKKIGESSSSERCINLFYCLSELHDDSLVEEVKKFLNSKDKEKRSPAQWSALVFVLLTSENNLDEFDLKQYSASEEGLLRLLPVVKTCKNARLNQCNLTASSCEALRSALSCSTLTELDLSHNSLQDSGAEVLFGEMRSPRCKLEVLRLSGCLLTQQSCGALALALTSSTSLRELDLSINDLEDSGLQQISPGLARLHKLSMSQCSLSHACCEGLSSALSQPHSALRELDLSNNHLQDQGVKLLSSGLQSVSCQLRILRLSGCGVSGEGCDSLAHVLTCKQSKLAELDLSYNHLDGRKLSGAKPTMKLDVDHCGEYRLQPGLLKYACKVTMDPHTAHQNLVVSDDHRTTTWKRQAQSLTDADRAERFDSRRQVLCEQGLTGGRSYWEAEITREVDLGVAYRSLKRKGEDGTSIGESNSWAMYRSDTNYTVRHDGASHSLPITPTASERVGMYLDWAKGTLSFYSVYSDRHKHLYTFQATFTDPLYPAFGFGVNAVVHLPQIQADGRQERPPGAE
ncbi:unnamed protein product [Gadus morhua 'NCC']